MAFLKYENIENNNNFMNKEIVIQIIYMCVYIYIYTLTTPEPRPV